MMHLHLAVRRWRSEELESDEFEPMWDGVEPELPGRKVALFWQLRLGRGESGWIFGVNVPRRRVVTIEDTVIAKDYPEGEAADACKALGASLV